MSWVARAVLSEAPYGVRGPELALMAGASLAALYEAAGAPGGVPAGGPAPCNERPTVAPIAGRVPRT